MRGLGSPHDLAGVLVVAHGDELDMSDMVRTRPFEEFEEGDQFGRTHTHSFIFSAVRPWPHRPADIRDERAASATRKPLAQRREGGHGPGSGRRRHNTNAETLPAYRRAHERFRELRCNRRDQRFR